MNVLLIGLGAAVATSLLYNSVEKKNSSSIQPPIPLEPEVQAEPALPLESRRNCREIIEDENDVEGRFDNLPRLETVYKNQAHSMNCLNGGDVLTATEQGMFPQITSHTGYSRIEASSPMVQRPPKTETQMVPPIANEQKQWSMATARGVERARDRQMTTENAYNSTENAYKDYNPFDFEQSSEKGIGEFIGRKGFGNGQFQTIRTGAENGDHLRFAHIGTERLRGLYQHALRPAGSNQNRGVGKALRRDMVVRQGGAHHKKYEQAEWRRDPVPNSVVGKHNNAVIMDVDMRRTNRQTTSRIDFPWLHEDLKVSCN